MEVTIVDKFLTSQNDQRMTRWWFFTNPFEIYIVKLDHLPKFLGLKITFVFKPPPTLQGTNISRLRKRKIIIFKSAKRMGYVSSLQSRWSLELAGAGPSQPMKATREARDLPIGKMGHPGCSYCPSSQSMFMIKRNQQNLIVPWNDIRKIYTNKNTFTCTTVYMYIYIN